MRHMLDTSDFPRGHFLQDDKNKKLLGFFKDECNGRAISEFIGLRAKLYSFICEGKLHNVKIVTLSKNQTNSALT